SRLTSEAFIPSVPMVTPSETQMVLHSIGVPPAARRPALTCSASSRRSQLQALVSTPLWPTPTFALARSFRLEPAAPSMARAGARSGAAVITALRRLAAAAGGGWSWAMGERISILGRAHTLPEMPAYLVPLIFLGFSAGLSNFGGAVGLGVLPLRRRNR